MTRARNSANQTDSYGQYQREPSGRSDFCPGRPRRELEFSMVHAADTVGEALEIRPESCCDQLERAERVDGELARLCDQMRQLQAEVARLRRARNPELDQGRQPRADHPRAELPHVKKRRPTPPGSREPQEEDIHCVAEPSRQRHMLEQAWDRSRKQPVFARPPTARRQPRSYSTRPSGRRCDG
jgi:hypothetical protein